MRFLLPLLSLLATQPGMASGEASSPLPTVALQVGTRSIRAEVAATVDERARGMMHRATLARDAGMLFVFGRDHGGEVCMWMKNTNIPLSAAFIDRDGRVLNIVHMAPRTTDLHCAAGRAEYVLELVQGAFADAGVKPGHRIGGLPK